MDPNATLESLRNLVQAVNDPNADTGDQAEAATEMASLFESLDNWLKSGGFPPVEWTEGF